MVDLALSCPFCQAELSIPENEWYYTCPNCGKRLNLESQYAFLRGLDAFEEGQAVLDRISPKTRRNPLNPIDKEALDLFLESYTALQLAFRAELSDVQRSVGVEMMANMAGEFMKRSMVSNLEMNYWMILLVIQNSQNEYDRLKQQINTSQGAAGFIQRMRWNGRLNQLRKSLAEMEQKLNVVEQNIDFVDIPKARNKSWKP